MNDLMISISRNALATASAPFPKQTLETMRQHTMTPKQTFGGISLKQKFSKVRNFRNFATYKYQGRGDSENSKLWKYHHWQKWCFHRKSGVSETFVGIMLKCYLYMNRNIKTNIHGTLMTYKSSALSRCFESSTTLTDQREIISGPELVWSMPSLVIP